jgi:hypothetical protein
LHTAGERRWVFGGRYADEHPRNRGRETVLDYAGVQFYIQAAMRIQRIAATGYIRSGTVNRPA